MMRMKTRMRRKIRRRMRRRMRMRTRRIGREKRTKGTPWRGQLPHRPSLQMTACDTAGLPAGNLRRSQQTHAHTQLPLRHFNRYPPISTARNRPSPTQLPPLQPEQEPKLSHKNGTEAGRKRSYAPPIRAIGEKKEGVSLFVSLVEERSNRLLVNYHSSRRV